ncbi:endonuclease/exonuclease/phosphatase family protein [Luteimonas sp. S4-F44]|uniref:endonuclease/exonuclease/phosphatase family protein n=1 Tax=Luteimonas sp. S4-F44 TaxID=2925842 RepID=UPI001F53A957|nr:endonuclease/exonuclease/phosphatase family protein [Luteimonas sp. S4-F44]UNK43783.1 endonuclease/exonuclease/phosphatase family protein [Luteimonas sp. S4-F44]
MTVSIRRALRWPLTWFLSAMAALSVPAVAADAPSPDLRVMGFNVRYAAPGDGVNVWEARRDLLVETIVRRRPHLVGTQELLRRQAEYLDAHLPGYAWFGTGRNGDDTDGNGNEHMGVFYDTKRLELREQGHFWLSDTPDVPGSDNFGQAMPRMATWGRFRDRASGREFYLFNTHFPHMDDAEPLRERCADLLLARIARLPADVPVVVTGDFNAVPNSPTHRRLVGPLRDAWEVSTARSGPAATVHAFTGQPTDRIDWILFRGLEAQRVETVTDQADGRFPSDHFPVVADFAWPPRH